MLTWMIGILCVGYYWCTWENYKERRDENMRRLKRYEDNPDWDGED